MKKERLVILLGTLMALIFFYLGLNQWLKQKTPPEPPPVVVKPTPKPTEESQPKVEKVEPPVEQKPETGKEKEDLIAKKIEEEKKKEEEKPKQAPVEQKNNLKAQKEKKEYVIQIGAFISKENAERALSRAKRMGYSGEIVSEDKFYKVRVKVRTDNIRAEVDKLKPVFGSVIVKQ